MSTDRHHATSGLPVWLVAGFLGITAAVTLAVAGPWATASTPLAAVLSAGSGLLVFAAFAPWNAVRASRRHRRAVGLLAEQLRIVGEGGEPNGLRQLVESSHGADLGPLRVGAAAIARDVASHRRTTRRMERAMGDSIRRETHRQTIQLQKQAQTDHLTGLANRRVLEQRMKELADAPAETQVDSVVAMVIDLDNFKIVNDALGHEAGDACLAFMGQLLRSSVRREDTAVRLGGDEFVVLMPGQSMPTAQRTAQRLAALFRQMPWTHRDVPRPSLSIGLAAAGPETLGDGRNLLRAADEALYRAKRSGRDRIEGGTDEGTEAPGHRGTRKGPTHQGIEA